MVTMGGNRIPWLRVRVHGDELPEMLLLTGKRRTLPRAKRPHNEESELDDSDG